VLPRGADDQRVQMVRRLAAEDESMDILGLDVTWTQEFAGARRCSTSNAASGCSTPGRG
jgi:multiple sugar transport system substrate-binding protein